MKTALFLNSTTSMAPLRPMFAGARLGKHGRPMRDEQGHENNDGPPDRNTDTNTENPPKKDNNTSETDPLASFWDSDDNDNSDEDSDPTPVDVAKIFGTESGAVKAEFTPEMLSQAADGNMDPINQHMTGVLQGAMKSMLRIMLPVMQGMEKELHHGFKKELNGKFESTSRESKLFQEIPAAKDKTIGPMVRQIYDKALVNSKNDIEKAITLTKDMMKIAGIGKQEAPDDSGRPSKTTDWLESLVGNGS